MRRLLLITSILLVAMVAMIPSVSGQGVWEQIDQEVPKHPSHSQGMGTYTYAQTFTAGMSGLLARVELNLQQQATSGASLTVEIRETTSDDAPTGNETLGSGTVLASATISVQAPNIQAPTSIPFETPPTIQSGEVYAIVVKAATGSWNWGWGEDYDGGHGYSCSDESCESMRENDFAFRTVVGAPDPIGPTGTFYINDGASFTNNLEVNLSLTCTDNLSGCATMAFSSNGTIYTSPVAFAPTAMYTLPDIDGVREVFVRFTDRAGSSSVESRMITLDRVAPDTTVTMYPSSPTNQTSASFEYIGFDAYNINHYECSLDNEEFAACPIPTEYFNLDEGLHRFQVRAVDPAGNVDVTPASYSWTVDTTEPDTTITLVPNSPTNQTSASFEYMGYDAYNISHYECSLDFEAFAACPTPTEYSGLDEGSHTFRVRTVDLAGNVDTTPASYTWIVETTQPTVTINQADTQADPTSAGTITFDVEFSEPVNGFAANDVNISKDLTLSDPTISITPSSGPASNYTVTLSGLIGDGSISVSIGAGAAVDQAGNLSQASTSTDNTVTIDQTAPVTTASISETPGQDDWYQTATITLSPDGPATTSYSINGATAQTYTGPFSLTTDGIHIITFWSVDILGNAESERSLVVKVDDTAPVFTQPLADRTLDPTSPDGAQVFFSPTVIDTLSSAGGITTTCVDQFNNPFQSGDIAPVGTTIITCTATDLAGNSNSVGFTVTVRGVGSLWEQLRATIVALDLTSSSERTLLVQTQIAEGLANANQVGLSCVQLSSLDMQIRAQESKRRISRQDAYEIYAQTALIRAVIGCGGSTT